MDLIIVESPNKVKDVRKYAAKAGVEAEVMATCGHMLDLPEMREGACVDTSTFEPTKVEPLDPAAAKRCRDIREAAKRAARVIVASDPDREGEAIAAQVWGLIPSEKAWRATFQEITEAGIAKGLREMRRQLDENAVDASGTRRVIDRLAGWHGTALLFQKLPQHKGLSAGRLQSAALRLVVERYREYASFQVTKTYGARARLRSGSSEFTARLVDAEGKALVFPNKEAVPAAAASKLRIAGLEEKEVQQKPRPPFQATSWLQVAQKALGLSVKDATAALQKLFEDGRTTYPRTDTVRVSEESIEWARGELARRFGNDLVPSTPWVHKDRKGDVQGAHEAIRPTLSADAAALAARANGQWGKEYELIELRFLASQAAARRVAKTTVSLQGDDGRLWRATGERELFAGWRKVLNSDAAEEDVTGAARKDGAEADADEGSLPNLTEGQTVEVLVVEVVELATTPKPLFSQASIVAELERLGIGRPSTYPTIVPLLTGRGWAEEKPMSEVKGCKAKKKDLPVLVPTTVGCDIYDFLAHALPGLVDLKFTADLEAQLDRIEVGKAARTEVGAAWWQHFESELAQAQSIAAKPRERPDLGACPRCAAAGRAGRLRLISGVNKDDRKAFAFAKCDADTKEETVCGLRLPVEKDKAIQVAQCPQCRSSMKPVEKRDGGKSWVCDQHGWFVASKKWQLVVPPKCPDCSVNMQHRAKKDGTSFFWACFEHKKFLDSDLFGAVTTKARRAS